MGNLGINHSVWLEKEDLKKLREKVAEGSLDAKIELSALDVEDAHDVEKNLAFLSDLAEKDKVLALMDLYFIYFEGVTRTEADGSETVLVAEDEDKAESYLRKAASLGSSWAMEGCAIRAMVKRMTCDEKDLTEEHFLEEEKWRLAADEASKTDKNDLAPSAVVSNMEALAALYENDNPKNPISNAEKAALWRSKANKKKNFDADF